MDMTASTNHTQNQNLTSTYAQEANKSSAGRPLTWYDADRYAFITLDLEIVTKLRLTRDDLFTQEITPEGGILLKRLKV